MPPDSLFVTISVLLKSVGLATILAFGSITRAGSTIVFCFLFLCWSVVSTTLNTGHIIGILQCGAWL
ncbi:hypothetical protein JB92DRAFT_2905762 [Gautieria morchelliformis]|nr:hypothetical protein JB92DRAFT_2905762 [Gautieria morchelliformis]